MSIINYTVAGGASWPGTIHLHSGELTSCLPCVCLCMPRVQTCIIHVYVSVYEYFHLYACASVCVCVCVCVCAWAHLQGGPRHPDPMHPDWGAL